MLLKLQIIRQAAPAAPITAGFPAHKAQRMVTTHATPDTKESVKVEKGPGGLGDVLGPIGLTVGKSFDKRKQKKEDSSAGVMQRAADAVGVSLGPIGLTIGSNVRHEESSSEDNEQFASSSTPIESMSTMTTEAWRSQFEKDGRVDVWMEDEFNAASRVVGGRVVHFGGVAGNKSGEGPSVSNAPRHKVKIKNHFAAQEIEVEVPEDRYILYEAEDQGLVLPYACRLGCCTACAVKVISGEMYQPHSLGVSRELRERGYALMCVGFPLTDLELETVPEDEVYDLQFGAYFEQMATDPSAPHIEHANMFEAGEFDD